MLTIPTIHIIRFLLLAVRNLPVTSLEYQCGQCITKVWNSISGTPIQTKDWTWDIGLNMAGNRGTLDGLPEGMGVMYVTDVQYAGMQAASFSGGDFMGIAGTKWKRNDAGEVILDKNGMPTYDKTLVAVGNRVIVYRWIEQHPYLEEFYFQYAMGIPCRWRCGQRYSICYG